MSGMHYSITCDLVVQFILHVCHIKHIPSASSIGYAQQTIHCQDFMIIHNKQNLFHCLILSAYSLGWYSF